MINKKEIINTAKSHKVSPQVIEKDYVLGWVLAGIYHNQSISKDWVFKGGTCLKKCYFDNYRFSEDLDFTLINSDPEHIQSFEKIFTDISEWIYQESGIEIPKQRINFKAYKNPQGNISCQGKLYYKGPIAPLSQHQLPRIKLDLSFHELLLTEPKKMTLYQKYSDTPNIGISALCYSLEEIFAEKIRALIDRTRPRDLYDVVNLYHYSKDNRISENLLQITKDKCQHKKIAGPNMESLNANKQRCELGWYEQLEHQLHELPAFDHFWDQLESVFIWMKDLSLTKPDASF